MEEGNEDISATPDALQLSPIDAPSKRITDTIYLKILVPSIAAGAIIGKNGEAIGQMQKETGAKIKLSKLNDFYPGTTERVCLIQGPLAGVRTMHDYIVERILEKPDVSSSSSGSSPAAAVATTPLGVEGGQVECEDELTRVARALSTAMAAQTPPAPPFWVTSGPRIVPPPPPLPPSQLLSGNNRLLWERHKQVKILVPNCTAGLVIGKQGSFVSEIKDSTGAFIQISQKSKDINLPERCITIAGEREQLRAAVDMVLSKIAEDPQSGTCPNISYSNAQGPVASAFPTGSPFAFIPTLGGSPAGPLATGGTRQSSGGVAPSTSFYNHQQQQLANYFAAAAMAAEYQQRLMAAAASTAGSYPPPPHHHHHPSGGGGGGGGGGGDMSGGSSSMESSGVFSPYGAVGRGGGGGGTSPPVDLPPDAEDLTVAAAAAAAAANAYFSMVQGGGPATAATGAYDPTPRFAFFHQTAGGSPAPGGPLSHAAAAGIYGSLGNSPPVLDSLGFPLVTSPPPNSHPQQQQLPPPPATHPHFGTGGTGGGNVFFPRISSSSSPLQHPMSTYTALLRNRGYSDEAVTEIAQAMSTLTAHGIIDINSASSGSTTEMVSVGIHNPCLQAALQSPENQTIDVGVADVGDQDGSEGLGGPTGNTNV